MISEKNCKHRWVMIFVDCLVALTLLIDCNSRLIVQPGLFYWVLTVDCGVDWTVGWHNYLLNEPQQSKQVPTLPALISEHFPIKLTANRFQNVNKLRTFMFNIKRLFEKQMKLNCNKIEMKIRFYLFYLLYLLRISVLVNPGQQWMPLLYQLLHIV